MTPIIHVWAFEPDRLGFSAEFDELPAAMTFAVAAAGAKGIVQIQIDDQLRNRQTDYKRLIDGSMVVVGEQPIDDRLPMVA